jgi:1-acyl-sn-glycerol-3-phosphate acyltransferase
MKLKTIAQPFYAAWVLITFMAGLLVVLPFYMLLSVRNNMRARKAISKLLKAWMRVWFVVIGMPVTVSGPKPPQGRYVVVANHISYLDPLVLFPALPNYFRPLGKQEFSKVPLLGYLYRQITIMVERGDAKSRARSMRNMWRVLQQEGDILIFPEGTFNETPNPLKDFHNGAFSLAINTHTPILPVIFPDTVHRWHYSGWWKWWPGRNRAIYLPPVPVDGLTMEDLPALKQQLYDMMWAALAQYNYP